MKTRSQNILLTLNSSPNFLAPISTLSRVFGDVEKMENSDDLISISGYS